MAVVVVVIVLVIVVVLRIVEIVVVVVVVTVDELLKPLEVAASRNFAKTNKTKMTFTKIQSKLFFISYNKS